MFYILLQSQMSKLQFCSESNYAAIFQLNSLPGKIFFELQIGNFFWGKFGKKEDILDWEWGLYSAPGDWEKRLCLCAKNVPYLTYGYLLVDRNFIGNAKLTGKVSIGRLQSLTTQVGS